ncbi:lactonase family protein [Aquimarina algicola]|uniref:Lactonase family protein n=1 Tax=Aquimarina algicola TaxID=2589995 RepID=A0A504JBW1_9FLAO|nr:lactonase family protein [Aquimarina algicola]TPN84409.1 lactonase family protein [Aquimarina algicola]
MIKLYLNKFLLIVLLVLVGGCKSVDYTQKKTSYWMYLSTSPAKDSDGIDIYIWNPEKGELKFYKKSKSLKKSKYIEINTAKNKLYSANDGVLSTYHIEKNGDLTVVDTLSYGKEKGAFLSLNNTKQFLLSSLYKSGKLMTFRLDSTGDIECKVTDIQHIGKGSNMRRQKSAHPHMSIQPRNSNVVIVPDLGDDKVYSYTLLQNGECVPSELPFVKLPDGVGPRYVAFHPSKEIIYILTELTSEIYVYSYHPKKGITEFINKISILPSGFKTLNTSADIAITDNGKFLYASNRGHNSIAICELDSLGNINFKHTIASNGDIPREFTLDPTGQFLLVANQKSNNLCVFKINQHTGNLILKQNISTGDSPQGFGFFRK